MLFAGAQWPQTRKAGLRYPASKTTEKENTMSNTEIVRAWKDPEYRSTLNLVPAHPAGQIELTDPDLDGSAAKVGGFGPETERHNVTGTCKTFSTHHKCGC